MESLNSYAAPAAGEHEAPFDIPTDLLIGNSWVEGHAQRPHRGGQSVDRWRADRDRRRHHRGRHRLCRCGRSRRCCLGRYRAPRTRHDPDGVLGKDDGECRMARPADQPGKRQVAARCARRSRLCRRILPLVCRGSSAHQRRAVDLARRQQPHPGPVSADRHLAADHAVEFPGGDGDAQDRASAGGRLHRHPEAGGGNPADRARRRADHARRGRACGCRQRRSTPATRRACAARCCTIRAYGSSVSPARPKSAASCCANAPIRCSAPRWSWAATPRSWCSTMPISTRRSRARWSPRCATPARPALRPNRFYVQRGIYEAFTAEAGRAHGRAEGRPGL